MATEQVPCPLCQGSAKTDENFHTEIDRYACSMCGEYYIKRDKVSDCLGNDQEREKYRARDIGHLLRERRAKHGERPIPFLQFEPDASAEPPNSFPIRVSDLLADWPRTIPERIERCFCYLVNSTPGGMTAGAEQTMSYVTPEAPLIFTDWNTDEADYFIKAMVDYKWLEGERDDFGVWRVVVTPYGWKHFDELTRREGTANDPAFVAMWFGGEHQQERDKMTKLYENAIKPAIRVAGYQEKRADSEEHNESIMDRIVEYIRKAPFVVAELTGNNQGVYYEAGFAKGRGTEVIYCCPEGTKPHFDVTGINQVRWKSEADLRQKLESRILGTMSRGPHRIDVCGV